MLVSELDLSLLESELRLRELALKMRPESGELANDGAAEFAVERLLDELNTFCDCIDAEESSLVAPNP